MADTPSQSNQGFFTRIPSNLPMKKWMAIGLFILIIVVLVIYIIVANNKAPSCPPCPPCPTCQSNTTPNKKTLLEDDSENSQLANS